MKKLIITGLCVLLMVITANAYSASFPIQADGNNLEECINDFYNRGYRREYANQINLYDAITLGKTKYVLVEINGELGVVTLVQNMIGRYQIDRLSSGSGNFTEKMVENKDKKYMLFGGRNINLKLANIKFALEGHHYSLNIPPEKHFFVCREIDPHIQSTHMDLNHLQFYNTQGTDMTEQVDWNGTSPE